VHKVEFGYLNRALATPFSKLPVLGSAMLGIVRIGSALLGSAMLGSAKTGCHAKKLEEETHEKPTK